AGNRCPAHLVDSHDRQSTYPLRACGNSRPERQQVIRLPSHTRQPEARLRWVPGLVVGGCRLQVDLLPLAFDYTLAYLGWSLAFFRHRVCVIQLFEASCALCSMGILEATM